MVPCSLVTPRDTVGSLVQDCCGVVTVNILVTVSVVVINLVVVTGDDTALVVTGDDIALAVISDDDTAVVTGDDESVNVFMEVDGTIDDNKLIIVELY